MAPKVAPKRRSAWLANALQRAEARRSSSAAKPRPQKYLQGVDVVALRAHVAAAAVAEAAAAADAGPSTMHDLPQPPPSAGAPRKPPARGVATHRLAVAADSWTGASVSASGWKRCRGSDLYMWHRSVTRKLERALPSAPPLAHNFCSHIVCARNPRFLGISLRGWHGPIGCSPTGACCRSQRGVCSRGAGAAIAGRPASAARAACTGEQQRQQWHQRQQQHRCGGTQRDCSRLLWSD
jgi:hypothetical protein